MIISASRRTDLPAFYSEWFMNRVRAGFVDVRNPFNRKQVSRISLQPKAVDCVVFWTKNAAPLLPYLSELEQYFPFYFQFTLNAYGRDIEPNLPERTELLHTFRTLACLLGKHRVVWRYDPIFLNERYMIKFHLENFKRLLEELHDATDCCVFSFLDFYRKTERNMRMLCPLLLDTGIMEEIAGSLALLAKDSGVKLQTCSEEINLEKFGIIRGACIEKERLETVIGGELKVSKDKTQRDVCHCVKSVDIGQYDTCCHLCRYCYANANAGTARLNYQEHDAASSLLSGHLCGDEKVTWRKTEHLSCENEELTLF